MVDVGFGNDKGAIHFFRPNKVLALMKLLMGVDAYWVFFQAVHRSISFGIFSLDMSNHLKTGDNFNFF